MLDNLALPDSSPLKLAAQGWLLHALLQGDVPRLLDPLLLPLLAPTTARVSVLRVSIQHRSTVLPNEADRAEARIYAISSEDGNVIYHVSPMQSSGIFKYFYVESLLMAINLWFRLKEAKLECSFWVFVIDFVYMTLFVVQRSKNSPFKVTQCEQGESSQYLIL